jgi:hypothetical protein
MAGFSAIEIDCKAAAETVIVTESETVAVVESE